MQSLPKQTNLLKLDLQGALRKPSRESLRKSLREVKKILAVDDQSFNLIVMREIIHEINSNILT